MKYILGQIVGLAIIVAAIVFASGLCRFTVWSNGYWNQIALQCRA